MIYAIGMRRGSFILLLLVRDFGPGTDGDWKVRRVTERAPRALGACISQEEGAWHS
jgi:hypothetical protein